MQIKLVPGNSAGTVTAYYLSSTGDEHDEIDFEFLGNSSRQPYVVHTNVYTRGHGGREQQFYLWFDPTADYHNYTIHWTNSTIVWYIDNVPIRVYRNHLDKGIPYPNQQGMRVYASIWNADSWATIGGQVKIDWSNAPFTAEFRRFRPRACYWNGPISISQCATSSLDHWWNLPEYDQLSSDKQGQMNSTRSNYMIYDYCKDTQRYNGLMPGECFQPEF
ncbi:hypothetical protein Leryth_001086 [Lithospermum erythrorhizon]|nr:hypothetical protein Leryth_001086 [Lithospermum erythrorhizon]